MRRAIVAIASSIAAGATLTACGSNSLGSTGPSVSTTATSSVDSAAVALLPAAIKAKGTLTVGSDASYAPSEFLAADGTTVQGFDVDLFKQVAATLGLKVTFQNATFGTIIGGVSSGKYDVGVSSFTINSDREKQANMVSYFSAGTQWATATGNPKKVDPANACGLNIGVQSGTVEVDDIKARSAACTKAGKAAIHIDQYDLQSAATAAVVSGKEDAMLADSPVTAYAVKLSNNKLQTLGDIYGSAPYGFVTAKSDPQLAQAIAAALKDVYASGAYKSVLDAWGVSQGAISTFVVNPPAS